MKIHNAIPWRGNKLELKNVTASNIAGAMIYTNELYHQHIIFRLHHVRRGWRSICFRLQNLICCQSILLC